MFVVGGLGEQKVIGEDSCASGSQQFVPLVVLIVLDGELRLDELGQRLLVCHELGVLQRWVRGFEGLDLEILGFGASHIFNLF